MPFQTFDIWDQSLLTDTIVNPPEGLDPGAAEAAEDSVGESIAPLRNHPGRNAKVRVAELKPYGKGQFRAPDASPPLFRPAVTWYEEVIELVLLDEMIRIPEEEWLLLNSADENLRRSAGVSVVDKGRMLRERNERLTAYMRWQMLLNGTLTISYAGTGQAFTIDYGFPSGHKVTVGTLWSSTATADPVADVQAWSEKLADDSGNYARHLHMNTKTFDYLIRNTKIIQSINFFAAGASPILRPRREDILNLFTSFAVNQDIIIYDNGYRDSGATGFGRPSLTKYLPDGKVLVTTDYTVGGRRLAEVLDGQVQVATGYNSTDIRQGAQAQVHLDPIPGTHYLRYAAARIPRLLFPDRILSATVA